MRWLSQYPHFFFFIQSAPEVKPAVQPEINTSENFWLALILNAI